jgi:hypothetical protein
MNIKKDKTNRKVILAYVAPLIAIIIVSYLLKNVNNSNGNKKEVDSKTVLHNKVSDADSTNIKKTKYDSSSVTINDSDSILKKNKKSESEIEVNYDNDKIREIKRLNLLISLSFQKSLSDAARVEQLERNHHEIRWDLINFNYLYKNNQPYGTDVSIGYHSFYNTVHIKFYNEEGRMIHLKLKRENFYFKGKKNSIWAFKFQGSIFDIEYVN